MIFQAGKTRKVQFQTPARPKANNIIITNQLRNNSEQPYLKNALLGVLQRHCH